ncbi:MAG: flagellar basal body-associated FliL family protein [Pseudomonadota bacterium]
MTEVVDGNPKKKRGGGLLIGLVLAAALGGGSFYAVQSGLAPAPSEMISGLLSGKDDAWVAPEFVELPTIVVSLGPEARARHLRVGVVLEVEPGRAEEVRASQPRIVATLNRFLRAVDERDFELPALMLRLQAQILRRVTIAAPEGTIRAVLLQEFLLS